MPNTSRKSEPHTIKTSSGHITYFERDFTEPEVLDKEVATKNLLTVHSVLATRVSFGLIYGTLLGAVRERDFIEHDTDIDLSVLEEDRQDLLDSIPNLISEGFSLCRYNDQLLSIERNGVYIDFYFFKKKFFGKRSCGAGHTISAKYLDRTREVLFLGALFKVPDKYEAACKQLYGRGWRVPQRNAPSMSFSNYIIMRELIKRRAPRLFHYLRLLRKKLQLS